MASSFVFQTNFDIFSTEASPRREMVALVDFRKIKQREDVQDTHSDIKGDTELEATEDIETKVDIDDALKMNWMT